MTASTLIVDPSNNSTTSVTTRTQVHDPVTTPTQLHDPVTTPTHAVSLITRLVTSTVFMPTCTGIVLLYKCPFFIPLVVILVSQVSTLQPATLVVAIPVTFVLTAIISSLLTLLATYLCLTRRGSHKLVQEPVYDPVSLDHVLKPPATKCMPTVPSTRRAIGTKSNEANGQSGDIVYESVLSY